MKRYLVRHHNGSESGPYTSSELKSLASSRRIRSDDMVSEAGTDQWVMASHVKGLHIDCVSQGVAQGCEPLATPSVSRSELSDASSSECRDELSTLRSAGARESVSDALPGLSSRLNSIAQSHQMLVRNKRGQHQVVWTVLLTLSLLVSIGVGIWYTNSDFRGVRGIDPEDTQAGFIAAAVAFLVYSLFVLVPAAVVISARKQDPVLHSLPVRLADAVNEEVEKLAFARLGKHTLARSDNGVLVACSQRGLVLCSIAEGCVHTFPRSTVTRVTVDTRQTSSASTTRSGSFASGVASVSGHYGVSGIDTHSETVTLHNYRTVVDVYTSAIDRPHFQLDFGADEDMGKRIYAILANSGASPGMNA